MNIRPNIHLTGAGNRPFLLDLYVADTPNGHLLIFCHGFKGFKDWGGWHEMAKYFASNGFHFVKFNFSHNGTTPDAPLDFDDLTAFGNNTFSKELFDLECVLDWVEQEKESGRLDYQHIHLIGHSRSGPIVLVKGQESPRIASVTTWAGVADLKGMLTRHTIEIWKKEGVIYIANARTNQQMPLFFSLYEDYMSNESRLDLDLLPKSRPIPIHIIHGDIDQAVPVEAADQLQSFFSRAKVDIIKGADHTFGCKHPQDTPLTEAARELITLTSSFILDMT